MLRCGGLGDPVLRLHDRAQLAGGTLSLGQQLEDPSPDRISEDVERVHEANILAVPYISQVLNTRDASIPHGGRGGADDLVEGHVRSQFAEIEDIAGDVEHAQIGDHTIDDSATGQGE